MIVWWLCIAAQAGLVLDPPAREGVESIVTVTRDDRPVPGATVRVFHREGLAGATELAVGITDARGRVRWTPEVPGSARLQAGKESLELHVAYQTAPSDAWIPWLMLWLAGAGMIGFARATGKES